MKNNFLTHLITLCIATVILVGCSKDDAIINNTEATASINANNGKMAPDPNGGAVTGSFNPIPLTVDVSVVQGEWLVVGVVTVGKEDFVIRNIPPGVYDLRIIYTMEDNGTQQQKLIKDLAIKAGETLNLGTISLNETNN